MAVVGVLSMELKSKSSYDVVARYRGCSQTSMERALWFTSSSVHPSESANMRSSSSICGERDRLPVELEVLPCVMTVTAALAGTAYALVIARC